MHSISMAGERLTTAPKVLRCTTGPYDDLALVQLTRCCAVPFAMGDMCDAFDWYGWGMTDDSTQGVALHDWPARRSHSDAAHSIVRGTVCNGRHVRYIRLVWLGNE
jgi:hypothetical protein